MEKPYFVMLYTQAGMTMVPAQDPEGNMYWFKTIEEARICAINTFFGDNFGYEIFEEGIGQL